MRKWAILTITGCIWLFNACKEEEPPNPFDDISQNVDTTTVDSFPYADHSLIALQKNVFSPTCANFGCHDGTFEPDFRTIESTYNTLLFHPIIKNDPQGSFEYRVVPYDADASVLMARLLYDIDGQSGIMPLESLDSDWEENKEQYIEDIRTWINEGAPDVLGNTYSPVDNKPRVLGVVGRVNGQDLPRGDANNGPLLVPQSDTLLTLYFAVQDDQTALSSFASTRIQLSRGPVNFNLSHIQDLDLMGQSFTAPGFTGDPVSYTFQTQLDLTVDTLFNANQLYFRVLADDGVNGTVGIPAENSARYLKRYFSFIRN